MNFIAHYYLEREHRQDWVVVGVSTPDLVSIYDRKARIKLSGLPADHEVVDPRKKDFLIGVRSHIEADKRFHSAPYFFEETALLGGMLKEAIHPVEIRRTFFIAHILFELIIDKILVQKYPELLTEYYAHMENPLIEEIDDFTGWLLKYDLPGYGTFFNRFVKRRYLEDYTEWKNIIYVLKRVMGRVNLDMAEIFYQPQVIACLEAYEHQLTPKVEQYLDYLKTE
ncbi:MAG: hypothetical protein AAFV78_05720 [Bacteroidota bacterium]